MTALVHTRAELQPFLDGFANRRTGVVMTMGALHEGHLELLKKARHDCDLVVATIFVNPLQFGPNEDFDRYPRTLDDDLKLCAEAGVDVVFAPAVAEVYPGGQPIVKVTPGEMGEVLEGEFRPGFFTGVLTVVNKLLNLTRPDVAFFGQKDAQQLALVRRMVLDLNMPVEIVGVPTVRDPDKSPPPPNPRERSDVPTHRQAQVPAGPRPRGRPALRRLGAHRRGPQGRGRPASRRAGRDRRHRQRRPPGDVRHTRGPRHRRDRRQRRRGPPGAPRGPGPPDLPQAGGRGRGADASAQGGARPHGDPDPGPRRRSGRDD